MAMAAVHGCDAFMKAPTHLPDLFVMMNVCIGCGVFVLIYLYMTWRACYQTAKNEEKKRK
jgi:hypothetical protein